MIEMNLKCPKRAISAEVGPIRHVRPSVVRRSSGDQRLVKANHLGRAGERTSTYWKAGMRGSNVGCQKRRSKRLRRGAIMPLGVALMRPHRRACGSPEERDRRRKWPRQSAGSRQELPPTDIWCVFARSRTSLSLPMPPSVSLNHAQIRWKFPDGWARVDGIRRGSFDRVMLPIKQEGAPVLSQNAGLIPALNEEVTIQRVVSGALRHLGQVVVVDDGSQDRTNEEATLAGAVVLRNEQTRGQGSSLIRGLQWLFDRDFDNVVILDGDGAHDPGWITKLLLAHLSACADLTIGSRFLDRRCTLPSCKQSANRFATSLLNEMFHLGVSDAASGMRVVSRHAGRLSFTREDFAFAFEMLRLCRLHGLAIHESAIEAHYDARELFCTSQTELLSLLDYCASATDAPSLAAKQCNDASAQVYNWATFCAEVSGELFVFHSLRHHGAYVIQEQDPTFKAPGGRGAVAIPLVISL